MLDIALKLSFSDLFKNFLKKTFFTIIFKVFLNISYSFNLFQNFKICV